MDQHMTAHNANRDARPSLRVMSWNIRSGFGSFGLPADLAGTSQIDTIAEVIRQSGADIVGLQEVDRHWDRSDNLDQPRYLAEVLGMDWCHGANWLPAGGQPGDAVPQYGTAILSRWRIEAHRNVHLPTPENWEQRGALVAEIRLDDGQLVTLINTHLQYGDPSNSDGTVTQRTEQLRGVLDLAMQANGAVVITGDFNATPGSVELRQIEDPDSGFVDAWVRSGAGGEGHTIEARPDTEPERRIDYIFAGTGVSVLGASVVITDLTRIASDHYPVVTDLEIVRPNT